jgi:hypothetical protein
MAEHGTTRRRLLIAGAAVAGSSLLTAEQAFADGYGSGPIGEYLNSPRVISGEEQVRTVLAQNGLFMFGDSISVQDAKSLAERLGGRTGDVLAVNNWTGRPTEHGVDALASWASTYGLPKRILMALGTNDIFTPPAFAAQVERTMSIAGANRTVFWVNVQACRTAKPAEVQLADQRNSGWVSLQLAEAARRHPNLHVVHWAEFLAAKIERLTAYLRDGVHTKVPLGQDARNELIVQAIEAG